MHDEWIHGSSLRAEAGDAIAAGFGGAEFELEERRVAGVDDGEVVGHLCHLWLPWNLRSRRGLHTYSCTAIS